MKCQRRVLWIALALALVAKPAESGQLGEARKTVVFLWKDMGGGARRVGTGFLVSRGSEVFLVTASHVVDELGPEPGVTIRAASGEPAEYKFREFLPGGGSPSWVKHQEADVSAIRVKKRPKSAKTVPLSMLEEAPRPPEAHVVVTTIGFPGGLGTLGDLFSPIWRDSEPASELLRHKRFDNKVEATFFFLQDPSVGGFSGAPVFVISERAFAPGARTTGGPFHCVGLIHGTFGDQSGGKFAAVVPAQEIVETIALVPLGSSPSSRGEPEPRGAAPR